ncbi:MAG: hypothetical protein HY897_16515, partial [Deltaproteobacteria bacterium]|nr:hypothetical protein [Deltaproteobacteria bacterium]
KVNDIQISQQTFNSLDDILSSSLSFGAAHSCCDGRNSNTVTVDNVVLAGVPANLPKALCACLTSSSNFQENLNLLTGAGFDVTVVSGAGSIPQDLSQYSLVWVNDYAAATPTAAGYLKSYVDGGGGVVSDSGAPYFLAGGNMANISDWFGASQYVNANCPMTVSTVVANPIGTSLANGTLLWDCPSGIGLPVMGDLEQMPRRSRITPAVRSLPLRTPT